MREERKFKEKISFLSGKHRMASKTKTIMIKNNIEKVIKRVIRHNFRRIENEKIISVDKPNLSQMFFHT